MVITFLELTTQKMLQEAVCAYIITLQLVDTPYIDKCILCEINIQNTTGYIVVIYRSPSHSSNEFEEFLVTFVKLFNQYA